MSSSNLNPDSLKKFYTPYLSDEESDYDLDSSYSSSSETSESSSSSKGSKGSEGSEGSEGVQESKGSTSSKGSQGSQGSQNSQSSEESNKEERIVPDNATEKKTNTFNNIGAPVSVLSGNYISPPKYSSIPQAFNQTNPEFKSTKVSTTVMINSLDRDNNIYPYPSNFTIRLPRVYRNIVSINVIQIKMLSAFYYFSDQKNNTHLRLYENGRTKTVNGQDISNNIDVYIRNGTYTMDELTIELNNQLNSVPLYNRITYSDFQTQFISTGDYTLLFNAPGETTYNKLTGIFDNLVTTSDIVNSYFFTGSNYGEPYFTYDEILVAYYYPLLKDITILQNTKTTPIVTSPYIQTNSKYILKTFKTYPSINYHLTDSDTADLLEGYTFYDRVVFGFQGLGDIYILKLLKDTSNLAILDTYKFDNTWDNFLVNKYVCSYNQTSGRCTFYSQQLNTSIVNTLTAKYTTYFTNALVQNKINPAQLVTVTTNSTNLNSSLIDMYNYIQTTFTDIFGINFGTYSSAFFSNLDNTLFIKDSLSRYGWNLAYSGAKPADTSTVIYSDQPVYWTNLPIDTDLIILPTVNNKEIYYRNPSGGPNVQYTYTTDLVSDISGFLILEGASEYNYGYQDIQVNINPTSYFTTSFKSYCRQTLYIETLPPINGLSEQYFLDPENTPLLVNTNGKYYIDSRAADFNFYDISQNMMDGADYMRSIDLSGKSIYLKFISQIEPSFDTNLQAGGLSIFPYQAHIFFKINHSGYRIPILFSANTYFMSDIYIEREDGLPFGVPIDIYWYRERAAFMSDVSNTLNNINTFNPKNYFINQTIAANEITHILTTEFVSYENSFIILKCSSPPPAKIPLRVFIIRNKPYGEYNIISDPNDLILRKMPFDQTYLNQKPTPETLFPYDFNSLLDSNKFRNSYDSNGVSNNLLNNIIITLDFTHYDPYSFSNTILISDNPLNYPFQFLSQALLPKNGTNSGSQFFYSGSNNEILDNIGNIYYNSQIATLEAPTDTTNEYVFCNWHSAMFQQNLFINSSVKPSSYPEQTIMPNVSDPYSFDSFSYNNTTYSPFSICASEETPLSTDIAYNKVIGGETHTAQQIFFDDSFTNIMGIPFLPPSSINILPTKIIIKFSYTQPTRNSTGLLTRSSPLNLLNNDSFLYSSFSSSTFFKNNSDLNLWDDKFINNRQNIALGIFYSKDIYGKNISDIKLNDALSTLTLKKIVQTSLWNSNADTINNTKTRSPEWGTYYVYEKLDTSSNLWLPFDNTVINSSLKHKWAVINKPADISKYIYIKHASNNSEASSYYTDVQNNSLCIVPFYPQLSASEKNSDTPINKPYDTWQVGSFNGLTYTARPYLPFSKSEVHSINPYLYFKPKNTYESICIEDINGAGLGIGSQSTYLGICGPFCFGSSSTNTVTIPNYSSMNFTPKTINFKPTFFNIRVNIIKQNTIYNPLFDLSMFSNPSSCYLDTQLFLYDTTNNISNNFNLNIAQLDIINNWGTEKAANFSNYDDDSGYNYMSFVNSYNVANNSKTTINIRGYLPTVKISSTLRITGKNWTDFGKLSLRTLAAEIDDLVTNSVSLNPDGTLNNNNYRILKRYTYNYAKALVKFNSFFVGTFTFGIGFTNASYAGYTVESLGFSDFMNQYIKIFIKVKSTVTGINNAQTTALTLIKNYIIKNYSGVLPDNVLKRNKYTDPLAFSILFKSAVSPIFTNSSDQWGLGWNLGFDKVDTILSTRHVSTTFIRILDDFIYLKLNDEFNINSIDITNKESLNKTRDTVGQSKSYFGKLLLNTFGSYSQTFIQATKTFSAPLGKIDKLSFNFFDSNHINIENYDCNFTLVLEISEMLDALDLNTVITKGGADKVLK